MSSTSIRRPAAKVFVATTVMLTFISFWRAAAIVLSDLASSAYYAGGDAEKVIGKSAPWFILAVMLFSYAVRALYIESSAMFVRGGVYRVVKEAMGGTLAKISVSALLFDYPVHAPANEHGAGLDVERPHRVAEQHHRQDEPGSTFADDLLGIATGVVGGGSQVGKDDRRRPPEGDEGQHHRGGDEDLYGRLGTLSERSHSWMSALSA